MATTITERVYDDLTHKLRQWEKLAPAPHEILGAIKSWQSLGNADIEAAANAAAGLAVKGGTRSVKAFANVPDMPAALAHLRTAHAAIKAQVEAERSAPPRDGGFAGVKAAPVDTARVQKLYNALRKIETLRQMTPRDIQALDKIGMAYAFASNEARNAGNKPVQQALMEASFAITTAYTAYSKGNNGTGNTKLAQARMFTDRALQLLRGA